MLCTTGKNADVTNALLVEGWIKMLPERFKVAFDVNRPDGMNGAHWMQCITLDGKNVDATPVAEQLRTDIAPEDDQCHQG